jgi:hypothetical protein
MRLVPGGCVMPRRAWTLLAIATAVVVASFGIGYWMGSGSSKDYTIYTGDCYAGVTVASCTVGAVTYGISDVVAWTDANGVGRGGPNDPGEWPTCLPSGQETKGLRFAGAMLPVSDDGLAATIVWVDCRGR